MTMLARAIHSKNFGIHSKNFGMHPIDLSQRQLRAFMTAFGQH